MKKVAIIFILVTFFYSQLFAQNHDPDFGVPYLGDVVKAAEREENTRFHTHDAGVYYENVTNDLFMPINFQMQVGSLKQNLVNLSKKYGWKMIWNLDTDYDIPAAFMINERKVPEIFAEAIFHLPIKINFYSKNKVIVVAPMYDKRETDVGHKYSINPRG